MTYWLQEHLLCCEAGCQINLLEHLRIRASKVLRWAVCDMETVHQRPSILVQKPLEADAAKRETKILIRCLEEGNKSGRSLLYGPSWARHIWNVLCELYVYWKLLSSVPFDLLCAGFATSFVLALEDTPLCSATGHSKSTATQNDDPSSHGQIALHSTLPLLAVTSPKSSDILFYSTETSEYLSNYRFIAVPVVERFQKSDNSKRIFSANSAYPAYVTCLEFSRGNHVAIGLSNGTAYFVEQNLPAMVAPATKWERFSVSPAINSIKLLPIQDPSLYAKFVGSITNLAFSPSLEEQEESGWLAIATERSGVWIWNKRSQQIIRVVRTKGIYGGCLRWIGLEESPESRPRFSEPELCQEKHLGRSEMDKWSNVFGGEGDITALDDCFYSHFPTSSSDHGSTQVLRTSQSHGSLHTLGHLQYSSTAQSRTGDSLLICGTLDGTVRVQKLWHSAIMMNLEEYSEHRISAIAQSSSYANSIPGTTAGILTHLLVHPLEFTSNEIKVPVLAVCKGNDYSLIHTLNVSLPFSPADTVGAASPMAEPIDPASIPLRGILNMLLPSKFSRRWLNTSHGLRNNAGPVLFPTDASMSKATLISASRLGTTNLVLTTIRPSGDTFGRPKSYQCTRFSYDPVSTSAVLQYVDRIKPLVPASASFPPRQENTSQESLEKGYYTNMLARAGLNSPAPRIPSFEQVKVDGSAQVCDHDISCGQVAWGKGRYARDLGAFLYEPGSLLDEGLAVALFELKRKLWYPSEGSRDM